jgi:predicted XRE-type DNA-binding protein
MAINHVTPADGNIFLDLGFEPDEAERLLAESERQIAERMAIRDYLLKELSSWIDSMKVESPRVLRRLQSLRRWSPYEETREVFP